MKKNPNDNYFKTDNDMILEDGDTEEQMIFLIDRENMIVVRSFLEEDIKPFIINFDGVTSKQKKEKMRLLYSELPKENSQYSYFVVEKVLGKRPSKKNIDAIYGMPREPIGMGARYRTSAMTTKVQEAIELYLYTKNEEFAGPVSKIIEELAEFFNIEGNAKIFPVAN